MILCDHSMLIDFCVYIYVAVRVERDALKLDIWVSYTQVQADGDVCPLSEKSVIC